MDLLEYQGKQLFAKHGVPVPEGRPATTVDEAVAAADELGYPVRDQGAGAGRRARQGGRHQARPEHATRRASTPRAILGMDIKGFTVHELYVEAASEIDEEYYAAFVFDRSAKKPMAMFSKMGGMDVEAVAEEDPEAMRTLHVDPLIGFQDFQGRRLAFEAGIAARRDPPGRRDALQALRRVRGRGRDARRGQPAADHQGARGGGARRQGHRGRQRPLPPPRPRRVPGRRRGGPPGADGARSAA